MNTNIKKALFGDGRHKRPPVLLAVTPPRTGERTLLGVENLLQSIAVPEPFSLELAGDVDGVNLLARCQDDQVVRQQLTAHYPQARIRQVPVDEDPIFVHVGEQAWGLTLRSGGPEYVPLRTFRDDDLLDAGSDPLLAVIGSLSNLRPGERVLCRLLLRSLGPDWSQAHQQKAYKNPGYQRPDPSYTYQTRPLQLDGVTHGRAGRGRPRRAPGLPLGAGRRDSQGVSPGSRFPAGPHRGRLGLVALEAGPQPGLRPAADQGEGGPHRLRCRLGGHRGAARHRRRTAGQGGAGAGGRRLPPLRPPCRGQVQGRQGEAHRANYEPPPRRAGALRQAQRPGRAGSGRPVAPARRKGRDAPAGTFLVPVLSCPRPGA